MHEFIRDLKFGIKVLAKDKAFTITALLTLAVCIGANTAIFTIVRSVILRPLPVPESDRIVLMSNQYPNAGVGRSVNSGVPDYYDRLRDATALEDQAVFRLSGNTIEINGSPERVRGLNATPSLFQLVRVRPMLGRAFSEEDGVPGQDQKVILSYGLWEELYGGDPNVVGRDLRLSGRPFTIAGVMPRDFLFYDPEVRLWTPVAFSAQQKSDENRHSNNWLNVGRLKPGATIQQVQSQVDALNAANLERFPKWKKLLIDAGFHTMVEPLQAVMVREVKATLYLLWGGAAFVLLIGAVNLANLAMARSNVRAKEIATRLALGAGRLNVTRQFVTEGVTLTLIGGAAGLAAGAGILKGLARVGLQEIPRSGEIHIDAFVVVFTLAISVVAGLMLGLVPLGHLLQIDLNNVLREEGRSGTITHRTQNARRLLVVAQIAFAFVLLIGAGLLLASFRQLLLVDPGFRADGVITAALNTPSTRYAGAPALRDFMNRTLETIRALPGVMAAGATTSIPLGGNYNDSVILAEGYQRQPGESLISPNQVTVTPGYMEAMHIDLVRGRLFGESDTDTSQPVVIVDERLASKFWRNQDPIGHRMYMPGSPDNIFKTDANTRWLTVVGVVRNVHLQDLEDKKNSAGTYYFPWSQSPERGAFLAVRAGYGVTMQTVRSAIAGIDPELPLYDIHTMEDRESTSLLPRRAAMLIALSFAVVALFLSAVGIYGVLAYLVSQRWREIGIRMALGSSESQIFRLVLREGMMLVTSGLALGIAGTIALGHVIENEIYGIRPMDPLVMASVLAVLGIVSLVACTLPARYAMHVDPATVLNS